MPPSGMRYERILPTLGTALIINLFEDETRVYADDSTRSCARASGSVIGGPFDHSWIIDTAEQVRVMGVNFRPGGAHALVRVAVSELATRDVDLEDLFGGAARRLRLRLLETPCPFQRLALLADWLRGLAEEPHMDAVVAHAIQRLEAAPDVTRIRLLARDCGLSEKQLGKLFRRHVGMTPKRYARLLRFRGVAGQAHSSTEVDWSQLAIDGGYCDQAHLAHEFRRFAGITPSAFIAARGPYLNHLSLD
jgi:AraC-like DNA-binding protein